jgi:mycothiol synthase
MMEDGSASPLINPVPPDETRRALSLIFGRVDPKQRDEQVETVVRSLSGGRSTSGLLGAYRKGTLCGAILAQLLPGRTAQVWLPRLVPGESLETAHTLFKAMNSWLREQHVELGQMLFEQIDELEERLLGEEGYDYLTDLLYLACLPDEFPTSPPESDVEFCPYGPNDRERLKVVIEATYRNSLDCPRLNDVRDMDAVVEGYQSSGEFRPEFWSIVQYGDGDVGCLLLADYPEYDNVELVYMGVVMQWRRRGWGKDIARFAEWQTRCLGRARLVVAVDAANEPAIAMYSAVGFRAWDRRRVYYWKSNAPVK